MNVTRNDDFQCSDNDTRLQIPDFFSAHLSDIDRHRVADHLANCQPCRQLYAILQYLHAADSIAGLSVSEHITRQQIIDYYQEAAMVSSTDRERIQKHLSSCQQCAMELDFLKALEADCILTVKKAFSRRSPNRQTLFAWLKSPILGYALFLLSAYPAYLWLTKKSVPTPASSAIILPESTVTLRESLRGIDSAVVVERLAGQRIVALRIPFYAIPTENTYAFDIKDSSEKITSLDPFTDFSHEGLIEIVADVSTVPDGLCTMSIREISQSAPPETLTVFFVFQLVTK